jgi:hypothetical protein
VPFCVSRPAYLNGSGGALGGAASGATRRGREAARRERIALRGRRGTALELRQVELRRSAGGLLRPRLRHGEVHRGRLAPRHNTGEGGEAHGDRGGAQRLIAGRKH